MRVRKHQGRETHRASDKIFCLAGGAGEEKDQQCPSSNAMQFGCEPKQTTLKRKIRKKTESQFTISLKLGALSRTHLRVTCDLFQSFSGAGCCFSTHRPRGHMVKGKTFPKRPTELLPASFTTSELQTLTVLCLKEKEAIKNELHWIFMQLYVEFLFFLRFPSDSQKQRC